MKRTLLTIACLVLASGVGRTPARGQAVYVASYYQAVPVAYAVATPEPAAAPAPQQPEPSPPPAPEPVKAVGPTITFPAGPVTLTVPAAFTLEQGDGYLTIRWSGSPTPPTPPPPKPDVPVPPTPPPTPAPIPEPGLRVLIVYETGQLSKLPRPQLAILYDTTFRDWLSGVVVKGADQKTPDWRVYDKDADLTSDAVLWKAALARPRASVPWLIVSNGKTGWEGPLPATVDDAKALIQRYVTP